MPDLMHVVVVCTRDPGKEEAWVFGPFDSAAKARDFMQAAERSNEYPFGLSNRAHFARNVIPASMPPTAVLINWNWRD